MGGDGTFTVTWDAPYAGGSGLTIDHYMVRKREVAGNLSAFWATGCPTTTARSSMATPAMFMEGLMNGVTYQAQVMATNSAGDERPWSDDDMRWRRPDRRRT